ncbi:Mis14-domain-containing protein [Suhomyces tanzawaensis NRRL Y-17324]|uniref:Mis14-domain-containing protein n=1 Tax=Suhomyces tanzawaensis NRRL Y-17324 TaxID=984487 RepID=A0A1E4SMK7_9ASCO|nr:Mis14-domain-containing protein [Suhomyces tanzawaensis NRRL Y-17324]ODV80751.1 Mis14-domain-containing protein [Suhomyces tanzawaensis NRRL Y-17324]
MPDYEKIALSKQDLRHVYSQVLQLTTAKLDLHLPTSDNDPLKNKVAGVLDEFLLGAFELAKSGLVVDGHAIDDGSIHELLSLKRKETVEPFDLAINTRLREVLLQVEQETIELTKLRRELPAKARGAYQELVRRTDGELSSILAGLEAEEDEDFEVSVPNIGEISSEYEKHVLMLNDLKKTIPERKAELDRYDETLRFLEEAYRRQEAEEV